ncbi:MAG: penicillin-binding protein 2 [Proteobacteria bacterium]|nr:penicillin-binding protein 2 [Pseudomonadota bacterium]
MATPVHIPELQRRYAYLVVFVLLVFGVLIGRLWQLQVARGAAFRAAAADNYLQERTIAAARGAIFDRSRRLLVGVRPSFDVYAAPRFVDDRALERFVRALGIDPERARVVRRRVAAARATRRNQRLLLLRDIDRDQLAQLEMLKTDVPAFDAVAVAQRHYLHGAVAAHLLGYMSEVTADDLARDTRGRYHAGQLVGRYGVERLFEDQLRGLTGVERVIVDAHGRRRHEPWAGALLGGQPQRVAPQAGNTLVLTIDLELQRRVERALRRYASGAAVVLEVETGRVLATASHPAFDANVLTGRLTPRQARELLDDPRRPLLDKVFRENYFPGSIFKVVTATAAVEDHLATWDEHITCKGVHSFGRRSFRCSHTHGKVDLHRALAESCNVYFYLLAERVGLDRLANYARLFGLGATTGVGLNGEVGGLIPTKAWYAERGRPFRLGFTLNAAIGQGSVKVTPIQVAALYAALANGGRLYAPQIVERIETPTGEVLQPFIPRLRRAINLRPETLQRLRAALVAVVADPKGTGHDARLEGLSVAGKTGTAQVIRRGFATAHALEDHSWFAAYAPVERPQIAVAVLIEHGGQAAKVAAPVAMEIVRSYFSKAAAAPSSASAPPTAERRAGGSP